MIDYSPKHIAALFLSLKDDTLEFFLSPEEYDSYYALDMRNKKDALMVIHKWLMPVDELWKTTQVLSLLKESLRHILTKKMILPVDVWLPGIDDVDDLYDYHEYESFLLLLWEELFHEPFFPADVRLYRERIDRNFVCFPHMPEMWETPEFKAD